jgi:hypothetical protein
MDDFLGSVDEIPVYSIEEVINGEAFKWVRI